MSHCKLLLYSQLHPEDLLVHGLAEVSDLIHKLQHELVLDHFLLIFVARVTSAHVRSLLALARAASEMLTGQGHHWRVPHVLLDGLLADGAIGKGLDTNEVLLQLLHELLGPRLRSLRRRELLFNRVQVVLLINADELGALRIVLLV